MADKEWCNHRAGSSCRCWFRVYLNFLLLLQFRSPRTKCYMPHGVSTNQIMRWFHCDCEASETLYLKFVRTEPCPGHGRLLFTKLPQKKRLASNPNDPFQTNRGNSIILDCFQRVIWKRFEYTLESLQPEDQYGFRPGRHAKKIATANIMCKQIDGMH